MSDEIYPVENRTSDWKEQFIENHWLNLGDTSLIDIKNPFFEQTRAEIDDPVGFVLGLMRRPEYFGFTCEHLFNKRMHPFQLAILHELWHKPFPMLVASRGAGKCADGKTLIFTDTGMTKIQELAPEGVVPTPHLKVLGENGFQQVAYAWNNGYGPTIKMSTRYGYNLEGTPNHPIRVVGDGKIIWKNMEDLSVGDRVVVSRSPEWHPNVTHIEDDVAYMLGLIVGDGGYTQREQITFTTADEELADAVSTTAVKVWGKPLRKQTAKYQYVLSSVAARASLFDRFGFTSSVCEHKSIPTSILKGPKSAAACFLRGLFDTDGCVVKNASHIELSAKSPEMIRTVQVLLTRFGVISRRKSKFNKKYKRTYWYLKIGGPSLRVFQREIGFGLKRKAKLLEEVASKACNPNTDLIPRQLVLDDILTVLATFPKQKRGDGYKAKHLNAYRVKQYDVSYELLGKILDSTAPYAQQTDAWKNLKRVHNQHYFYDVITSLEPGACVTYDVHVPDDHSFVSNGIISHNSFILAIYAMLRSLFDQGSKIVIVGAGFRQAKVIFDYCVDIWDKSPVLQDLVGRSARNGPKHEPDKWTFRLGDSVIAALPLGDGCLVGSTMVTYGDRFGTIADDAPPANGTKQRDRLVWGNWTFRNSDEAYNNGTKPTKRITTERGYAIEGTHNHKIRVLREKRLVWVRLDEIVVGDSVPLDRSIRWHFGKTQCDGYELGRIGTKFVPDCVLSADSETVKEYLRGICDVYGYVNQHLIGIFNKSHRILEQIQYILLHYGVASYLNRHSWYSDLLIEREDIHTFAEQIGFRDSELRERLAKLVANTPKIYAPSIFYDQVVEMTDGLSPTYDIHVPEGHEYCANGFFSHNTKIRGQRANIIIADEFAFIKKEIFETVVRAFAAVNADPVEQAMYEARKEAIKKLGIWSDMHQQLEDQFGVTNQTIIAGTAFYAFNHFYEYWKKYKAIVESKGDRKKLVDLTGDPSILESTLNWKDYSIIRLPVEKLPPGFMNAKQIAQAKATIHSGTFAMEYSACFPSGTKLLTPQGLTSIENIKVGDKVLTHKGRFRPVTEVFVRHYDGDIVSYSTTGYNKPVLVTPEHPYWVGGDHWTSIGFLKGNTEIARLREFSGETQVEWGGQTLALDYNLGLVTGRCAVAGLPCLKDYIYANEQFLRGFIAGFWEAEGFLSKDESLLSQVRVGMSYFGIYTSIGDGLSIDESDTLSDRWRPQILHHELVPYNGPVYNLEVEEDHSYTLLNATVHNCFITDSSGFFKRSLIESCVAGTNKIEYPSCGQVNFTASLKGRPDRPYVIAVDPASEHDNFSVVVLERWPEHRRVVYCWTTTRARHKTRLNKGIVEDQNFYVYCANKIRELTRVFPCEALAIDTQGGGVSIIEALGDDSRLKKGERRILPVINPDVPKSTDGIDGLHIIELINFAKSDWVRDANHGLRKDMEDKTLLFPYFDPITVALAYEEDQATGRVVINHNDNTSEKLYDTLEDCVMEIEDLKEELATIVHTQTGTTMRDRWDTPDSKVEGNRKGKLRKDRYSALLMANMVCRTISRKPTEDPYVSSGQSANPGDVRKRKIGEAMWISNDNYGSWWSENWKQNWKNTGNYGAVVRKDGV